MKSETSVVPGADIATSEKAGRHAQLLELNELNLSIVQAFVEQHPERKGFRHLLDFNKSVTRIEEHYDSGFLEPWVQWVSIHSGMPSSEHQVAHLGDVPQLKYPQLWERLSERGISSGVVGCMNAQVASAENCEYFLPDPWTFSEAGRPAIIQQLLKLPRYLSKNYLDLSGFKIAAALPGLLVALGRLVGPLFLIQKLGALARAYLRFGQKHFIYICAFDSLLTRAYLNLQRTYKSNFAILFLNSMAHVQHHYWREELPRLTPEMEYALKNMDDLLCDIFSRADDEEQIFVANGLNQMQSYFLEDWILYRQKDIDQLLKRLGVPFRRAESLMSYDCQLICANEADRKRAAEILSDVRVGSEKLFLVEENREDPNLLFFRVNIFSSLEPHVKMTFGGRELPFFEQFEAVVKRSGRHTPSAFLLSRKSMPRAQLMNYEIFDEILAYFEADDRSSQDALKKEASLPG